ncbi:MAG: Major facilitator superfamily 1, partial [Cyanobacteria bacterium RYN_339]|nr:Major facilitator superfamily 1 [Cyanobacteria bacterium RYN_339]
LSLWGVAAFKVAYIAAGFLFLMSICLASTFGLVNTIIQERAPNHLRGRVSALTSMVFFGLQPVTALGLTSFADAVGMTRAMLIGAPIYAIGALIVLAGPGRKASAPQEASQTPS